MCLNELRQFASIARDEIRRHHPADSCVASTWITIQVMRRLGFSAEPREVVVSVGNKAYAALWKAYGPPKTMEQLEEWTNQFGAYVVGIGHDQKPGGIGGHLVCTVESRFLVDSSLDQASNPKYDLIIPPVVFFPVEPRRLSLGIVRSVQPHLFIEYINRPVIEDYKSLPAWGRTHEVHEAVEQILQKLNR